MSISKWKVCPIRRRLIRLGKMRILSTSSSISWNSHSEESHTKTRSDAQNMSATSRDMQMRSKIIRKSRICTRRSWMSSLKTVSASMQTVMSMHWISSTSEWPTRKSKIHSPIVATFQMISIVKVHSRWDRGLWWNPYITFHKKKSDETIKNLKF